MISAYNGHTVDVGRVLADSTWHHWFDINITGVAAPPSPYAGFDATVAYMQGTLKSAGPTGPLLERLRSGEIDARLKTLASPT